MRARPTLWRHDRDVNVNFFAPRALVQFAVRLTTTQLRVYVPSVLWPSLASRAAIMHTLCLRALFPAAVGSRRLPPLLLPTDMRLSGQVGAA